MAENTTKLAVITGGGRGIGRSTALALARNGVDVVLTYTSQEDSVRGVARDVEQLGRKAAVLRLDTAEISAFPEFVARLRTSLTTTWSRDHIDFLVNNAGIGLTAPIEQSTEAMFDQLMAIHLKGVFF